MAGLDPAISRNRDETAGSSPAVTFQDYSAAFFSVGRVATAVS
jgi:hypothetical protein